MFGQQQPGASLSSPFWPPTTNAWGMFTKFYCFTFMHELDIFKGPESDHPTSLWNPWSSSAEDQAQFLTCLATYPVQESLKSL